MFRINVSSIDSGADDPVSAGGSGATARTYFDATYGAAGIRRRLVCNELTALTVATSHVPEHSLVMVVVNSTIDGGSGGSIATYSLAPGATEIALHEAGHTVYGLADEYPCYACNGETGHDHHPPGEPTEPNVTTNSNRATLKWRGAVAASTAIPTMSNPNCSTVDNRPSPVPTGTVGLFEGATITIAGPTGPSTNCKMRALAVPFCGICRQTIRKRIEPLMPPDLGQARLDAVWVKEAEFRPAVWGWARADFDKKHAKLQSQGYQPATINAFVLAPPQVPRPVTAEPTVDQAVR